MFYRPSPVNLPVSKGYTSASCLARMSPPKHRCYLHTKVRTLWLSFLAIFHNSVVIQACAAGCQKNQVVQNLTFISHVACGYYSVKNIRNDVRQIITRDTHVQTSLRECSRLSSYFPNYVFYVANSCVLGTRRSYHVNMAIVVILSWQVQRVC